MKKFFEKKYLFILLLSVFITRSLIAFTFPSVASWDGAVYIGMGKYIFSQGTVGVWEVFRPVLWPTLLGLFWKVGINPILIGKVVVFFSSCSVLFLTYRIGEKMRNWAGIYAATILCFLPVFFQYSRIPMTDILSTACVLLVVWILIGMHSPKRLITAGIAAGCAFLFRFPQGLVLLAGSCVVVAEIIFYTQANSKEKIKKAILHLSFFALGFLVSTAPFFISNIYLYKDILLPLIQGKEIVKNFPARYHKGFFFYFKSLFQQSAFVLFFIPAALLLCTKKLTRTSVYVFVVVIVYGAYFLYQPHKEVRYMLAFLPYVFLLAGMGVAWFADKCRIPKKIIFLILLLMGSVRIIHELRVLPYDEVPVKNFSAFFADTPGAKLLSTSPFPALYGDVKIMRYLYDDWNYALDSYTELRNEIDYIALDSCVLEVACDPSDVQCYAGKEELLHELNSKQKRVFFEKSANRCEMSIYNIQH